MEITLGVVLALTALIGWGGGDFLIQRTTRLVGSAKALFFIGVVAFVGLTPFVIDDLPLLSLTDLLLLCVVSLVVMIGAAFDFEALRKGKMAIVEPVVGLELPMAVALSVVFVGDHLSPLEWLFMVFIFLGTLLVVTRSVKHLSTHLLEKGVWLAFLAAIGTALTSVMIGVASKEISPLVSVWFSHGALALVSGFAILVSGGFKTILRDIRKHPITIGAQSILDNAAWITFAFATTYIPISVATAISGGYVAFAVMLGIFINKEKIRHHQLAGIVAVSIGIVVLSYLYT